MQPLQDMYRLSTGGVDIAPRVPVIWALYQPVSVSGALFVYSEHQVSRHHPSAPRAKHIVHIDLLKDAEALRTDRTMSVATASLMGVQLATEEETRTGRQPTYGGSMPWRCCAYSKVSVSRI